MIDWIVSLASLLVSIVAIVISIQQTRLSNKQQLFEKRAAKYVEISELLNNYWNIQDSLNQKMILTSLSTPPVAIKMILKSSTRVIDCLLSPLRATSEDKLSTIIDLCHRLKQSAVEISLLWKDRKFSHVEEFFNLYSEFLASISNYDFCCKLAKGSSSGQITDEIEARLNHEAEKLQLLQQRDALLKVANQIEQDNILQSLKKSIRL